MTSPVFDLNLPRNPLRRSNARFLLVRSVGLGVLLWLYSVQAGEQRVTPTASRGASVQFTPASVKNFNADLKPLHIPAAN